MNYTVALVEDNATNRNSFLQNIRSLDNVEIAFIATNGQECLGELKGMHPAKLPQVIFMDLEMPKMNGIETISIARTLYPGIHFIVLTVFDDDEKIFDAIRAGASGYLLKHEPAGELMEAIRNVLEFGGAPMSPAIARKVLENMRAPKADTATASCKNDLPQIITAREEEILRQMVRGWDTKRMAAELDLSVLTVRKHIANIYEKLHINSRAQAITMAHDNKWFR